MAAEYNFTIEQGATFRRTLTWKDSAGTPINLTGCTARLKAKRPDGSVIFSLTSILNAGITLGGALGTIALFISDEDTTVFSFDIARYDLEVELSNGDVKRLLQGRVTLLTETTTP